MNEFNAKAEEMVESLPNDAEWSVTEIEEKLRELVENFGIPLDEAESSVLSNIEEDYDGELDLSSRTEQDPNLSIAELEVSHDDEWFNIQGEITRIFDLSDSQKEWLEQRGIIADDTGDTIFTVPEEAVESDSSLKLEKGQSYKIDGAVGDAYKGDVGIKLVSTTSANEIDRDFSPPESVIDITGCIVDVQKGSGLIKRCSEDGCSQTLDQGRCREHGAVEGVDDIRIKAVIDDGEKARQIFFDTEATASLTGIKLDDAIEMATEAMDREVVVREMKSLILNRYYHVEGFDMGQYLNVTDFERVNNSKEALAEQARKFLAEAREVMQ